MNAEQVLTIYIVGVCLFIIACGYNGDDLALGFAVIWPLIVPAALLYSLGRFLREIRNER